jgi:hypothetical protein
MTSHIKSFEIKLAHRISHHSYDVGKFQHTFYMGIHEQSIIFPALSHGGKLVHFVSLSRLIFNKTFAAPTLPNSLPTHVDVVYFNTQYFFIAQRRCSEQKKSPFFSLLVRSASSYNRIFFSAPLHHEHNIVPIHNKSDIWKIIFNRAKNLLENFYSGVLRHLTILL